MTGTMQGVMTGELGRFQSGRSNTRDACDVQKYRTVDDVCFGSLAEIVSRARHVRSSPSKQTFVSASGTSPLCARSRYPHTVSFSRAQKAALPSKLRRAILIEAGPSRLGGELAQGV